MPISIPDIAHRNLVGPFDAAPEFDCAMRNLSYSYALHLMPSRSPLIDVFDALRLSIDCNISRPAPNPLPSWPFYTSPNLSGVGGAAAVLRTHAPSAGAFYVDSDTGIDTNAGTEAAPFKTIPRALLATRSSGNGNGNGQIILREGTYILSEPAILGPTDNGLIMSAFPGEAPLISGGIPLNDLLWTKVGPAPPLPNTSGENNATIWSTSLASVQKISLPFGSLFLDGRRMVRARYPNGNPEYDISPQGYTTAAAWGPSPPFNESSLIQQNPLLTGTGVTRAACPPDACTSNGPQGIGPPWAIFCCNFWGWNASVTNWSSGSFWGTQPGPPGGGTAQMPGSLTAGNDTLLRLKNWEQQSVSDVIVHAFHGSYWGDWAWQLQSVNADNGEIVFSKGGFQEARGDSKGGVLYYENILAELDFPGEWFLDPAQSLLYYVTNGTSTPPPPATGFVAGQVKNLISVIGTAATPVFNISFTGLTFSYSEATFLDPFQVPSGGDMSYHDGGALRLSGTEKINVEGCLFLNLGGSGVMISGYNRDPTILDSEFLWLGEHAIASMGTSGDRFDNSDGAGVVIGTTLRRVLCHEIGLFVAQTGCYYHAMTANASITENVFFNGPRAGINVNDGYGGGHDISRNVGFNFVRSTTDHGVYNSWVRSAK